MLFVLFILCLVFRLALLWFCGFWIKWWFVCLIVSVWSGLLIIMLVWFCLLFIIWLKFGVSCFNWLLLLLLVYGCCCCLFIYLGGGGAQLDWCTYGLALFWSCYVAYLLFVMLRRFCLCWLLVLACFWCWFLNLWIRVRFGVGIRHSFGEIWMLSGICCRFDLCFGFGYSGAW